MTVVYKSNKAKIGDGLRITRVSDGGQKLEVLTDAKAGTYSEVILIGDVAPAPVPTPPPVPVPPATSGITPAGFAAALASAKPGDTLLLAAGDFGLMQSRQTYLPAITIKSADPANKAKFRGLDLQNVKGIRFVGITFDYQFKAGDPLHVKPFSVATCYDIGFDGCLFDGDNGMGLDATSNGFSVGRGLAIDGSTKIVVTNCKFKTWALGLLLTNSADVTVKDNEIYDIRSDGIDCVQVQRVVIEGNNIHDFRASVASS